MGLKLRAYQEQGLSAVEAALKEGVTRQLLVMACGLGKTISFAELIKRRGGRALILAHRDELLKQAVDKLLMVAPEYAGKVGVVRAEQDERDKQVVVASVQTVTQDKRKLDAEWNTVIVDEVHHAAAASYRKVLGALETPLLLGVTATPERTDRKSLFDIFQKIVFRYSLLQGVGAGYLCDLRSKQVALAGLDLDLVKTRGEDWDTGDLGAALEEVEAPRKTAAAVLEYGKGRKALVFTPTVATAVQTFEELGKAGLRATWVSGETPVEERRKRVGDFAEGKYQAMVNCAVLLEGYDEPTVDCVVIARPTRSRIMYQQIIGRGTRLALGKSDCLVLDLVGAEQSAGQVTFEELFSLSKASAEKGLLETLRAVHGQAQAGQEGAQIEVVERGRLHWIEDERPEGSRWLLSCGEETLVLGRLDAKWAIRSLPRDRQAAGRLLYRDLTLEYAQGVAEDYVRAAGAWGLVDPGASWRRVPASEKQLELLRKMKVVTRPGLTKGEASDLLSKRFLKHR